MIYVLIIVTGIGGSWNGMSSGEFPWTAVIGFGLLPVSFLFGCFLGLVGLLCGWLILRLGG